MEPAMTDNRYRDQPEAGLHLPPRRILVVIDPTAQEQPALDKAVRIATRCGSSLELYICDVAQQLPESWAGGARFDDYRELRRQQLVDELAVLAEPLRERGMAVDTVCEWHAPLEQGIGEHAIRTQPDLVVKDTHRHVPLTRASLSYTDWNLIRVLPMPLLLARARPWAKVVRTAAAVDPCHPADRPVALDARIVEGAHAFAGMFDGVMDVYHVLQTPPHLPGDRVSSEQIEAAHAHAREAVGQLALAGAARTQFIEALVPDGLTQLVEQYRPDVLAIGAVARPRSIHAAAGGTAARVLERVDCDLLVLKPPGFVSPLLVTSD
jgi:universal stress protein E